MIEVKLEDSKVIKELYEVIKTEIIKRNDNPSYELEVREFDSLEVPDSLKGKYYNEYGSVQFKNSLGSNILLKIGRTHPHKHNGLMGLNGIPSMNAEIIVDGEVVWRLKVVSGTLYYKAEVSDLNIPVDLLDVVLEDGLIADAEIVTQVVSREKIEFDDSLNKRILKIEEANRNLLIECDKEIELTIKKIKKTYLEKIAENNKELEFLKEEVNSYKELVRKYTTFNIDFIGKVFSYLMSLFERDIYVFKEFKTILEKDSSNLWGYMVDERPVLIIALVKEGRFNYLENGEDIINDDSSIILVISESSFDKVKEDSIEFYEFNNGKFKSLIDFSRFSYLKDFINYLIEYRYQKDIDCFTDEEVSSIIKEFISNNRENILNYYGSLLDSKILKLKF